MAQQRPDITLIPSQQSTANAADQVIRPGSEYLRGVGRAIGCQCVGVHTPQPLRFVWHHILPKACGGRTTKTNLLSCCDSCHYAIHLMMGDLKHNDGNMVLYKRFNGTNRANWAREGYQRAVDAGTVSKIPDQGAD